MLSLRTPTLAAATLLATLIAPPVLAADGDYDPDFGTAGIAYITPDDVDAHGLQPYAVTQLPDGRLLFGGVRDIPTAVPFEQQYRGMLARMNADGSPDSSFGNTSIPGVVVLPDIVPGARMEGIEAMRVLDDGSIVAVGLSQVNINPLRGFVIKLHADGSVDEDFGTQGVVTVPLTYLHAVGVDTQGRILASGESINTSNFVYTSTVIRFTSDGTPDDSFGDGGTATIDWDGAGNSGYLADLLMTDDDGVIVGGSYSVYGDGFGGDYAVARLDSGGSLDTNFADVGWRVFHDPTDTSMINAINRLARTPDGGIGFAGYYAGPESTTALIVGHLAEDGSTDEAFGDAGTPGYLRPPMPTGSQSANATALLAQPDGKLLVSLSYFSGAEKQLFVAMRSTATGALDDTFSDAGVFTADLAPDGIYSDLGTMTLQEDGRIVLAGRSLRDANNPVVDLAVVRLLNGGAPDDTIFANGFDL